MTAITNRQRELGGVIPDRPLQSGFVLVPADLKVRLKGDCLAWKSWMADHDRFVWTHLPGSHSGVYPSDRYRQVNPGAGLLASFMKLHSSSRQAILDFATRWGVLDAGDLTDELDTAPVLDMKRKEHLEPVSIWRDLSKRANAIANIAAELNQGRLGRAEDWNSDPFLSQNYSDWLRPESRRAWWTDTTLLEVARRMVAVALNDWLHSGRAKIVLSWSDDRSQWEIRLVADKMLNVFGVLAMKLMLAISEKDGLAICSSCHRSYLPRNRPDPTRRNYCPDCGIRAAWRDAARDARARRRAAKQRKK